MASKKRDPAQLEDINTSLDKVLKEKVSQDPWFNAHELAHVKAGHFCGRCKHWADRTKGQEELHRDEFWDRCFHQYDDGHDFKLRQIGNPYDYSVCSKRGCAAHQYSTCDQWEPK